ncbi:hypothetical protein DUNSADRAFT_4692 [Dunaliella salina]|uniref:DUF1990 domain-containing protein n=1 Tax=Dunaliella salina TaxID=3046 RepID=A0ABQ7H7H9_DUNSA|nr:hypothetical protein DUNSADRAFT_4692 [Dunaliella salina]|eukprot:KAF5842808.1 hypothetical protein DUNSADRAFT_4692 [Dunaliella salina]
MGRLFPFYLWRPGKEQQDEVLKEGVREGFNYPNPGATEGATPSDLIALSSPWVVDYKRVQVGKGSKAYEEAKAALKRWTHFQLGWAQVRNPVGAGLPVSSPVQRFQFGHGCLKGHLLAGEESFAVEWDKEDDSVWYEVMTFSRPAHPVAMATYPLVRFYQRQYGKDSSTAMVKAISNSS